MHRFVKNCAECLRFAADLPKTGVEKWRMNDNVVYNKMPSLNTKQLDLPEDMTEYSIENRLHAYSYDDLLRCGHGQLFGPGNARLPLPPMLMFDRITRINDNGGSAGKGEVVAEFDIRSDLWFFGCHFESDPVMPGCLGLDALWQLCGFFLGWIGGKGAGRALGVGEVRFGGQVLPSVKKVTYHVDFKRVINRKLIMGIANGRVEADGETIYEADDLKVGLFVNPSQPNGQQG